MAGKGDKPRPYNKPKFDENYSQINWIKKTPVKFKTGCEEWYTTILAEEMKKNLPEWTGDEPNI